MFLHICFSITICIHIHVQIKQPHKHGVCRFMSRPVISLWVITNTSLLEDSKEHALYWTLSWLRVYTWDIILRNVWDTGRCLQASQMHSHTPLCTCTQIKKEENAVQQCYKLQVIHTCNDQSLNIKYSRNVKELVTYTQVQSMCHSFCQLFVFS